MSDQLHTLPFTQLPEWILYHPDLSDRAVRVYAYLARRASQDPNAFPSHKNIAEMIHCSVSTIKRALQELEDAKAIVVQKRRRKNGSQTSNDYWLWPAKPPTVVEEGGFTGEPGVTGDLGGQFTGELGGEVTGELPLNRVNTKESHKEESYIVVNALCEQFVKLLNAHRGSEFSITEPWREEMRKFLAYGPDGIKKPAGWNAASIENGMERVFSQLNVRQGPRNFCWADQIQSVKALRRNWETMMFQLQTTPGQLVEDEYGNWYRAG